MKNQSEVAAQENSEVAASNIVSAALVHMRDRAATYDAPGGERSMGKVVGAFRELTGINMTEEQGHLFMCCLKMARATQGDFRLDNYEDLAAYAGLAGEAAAKEYGRRDISEVTQ